jgi:threonine dehydrogenase-like Zn-dependent dehydrogenase
MKAVVFHEIGDIRLEAVAEPQIQAPTDAIVRIELAAICGTDLHMVRGSLGPMAPGTILGHEAVGVVEELGAEVRNLSVGDRVVVCATIGCGYCSYCRSGYYSQCDNANPNGRAAGTAFFGGPLSSGPFDGLQAERARIPFANVGLYKLPEAISREQGIFLSDVLPTGYFGARLAQIKTGDTVAVFGCGPVGQMAIACARLLGAGRIFAIDRVRSRLELARGQEAEVIDFSAEDPVEALLSLTGGIGVDRAIDAVGVDSQAPQSGPAARACAALAERFTAELAQVAPQLNSQAQSFRPGEAPSLALRWAVAGLAKAGTLAIIGVYPKPADFFPLGLAMDKNLTVNMGTCNHRKYLPALVRLIEEQALEPGRFLSTSEGLSRALDAYLAFDAAERDWLKVALIPGR